MKKVFVFILVSVCVFFSVSVSAFADVGPKSSVKVYVNGVEDGREYYIALVEKLDEKYIRSKDEMEKKINEFARADGYGIGNGPVDEPYHKMSGRDSARWGYMPPKTFKILLYFPDNESFLVSDVQDKYAFSAYYYVEVNGDSLTVAPHGGAKGIAVEAGGLLVRIALTVLIEIGVALGFGYSAKHELKLILITNIITQVLLNALIAYGDYTFGGLGATFTYIVGEFLVFIAEAIVYSIKLPKISEVGTTHSPAGYAFLANLASFFGGAVLLMLADTLFNAIMGG